MDIGISILVTFVLILVNGTSPPSRWRSSMPARLFFRRKQRRVRKKPRERSTSRPIPIVSSPPFKSPLRSSGFSPPRPPLRTSRSLFPEWLSSFGVEWLALVAPGLAPVLITLIVSYFSIVIGELVPKRIALSSAESVSKAVAGPLSIFQKIFSPIVRFTAASADLLARIMRVKSADDRQDVSEEEIRYIVADNEELDDDEKRMIHEVLDLGDSTAGEVMTPRVDMIMVEDSETVKQAIDRMRGTGYSRLPVFHEELKTTSSALFAIKTSSTLCLTTERRMRLSITLPMWTLYPKARTCFRCSTKCKRIVNRWPLSSTNTVEPLV